jgi:replicative DNA helicase
MALLLENAFYRVAGILRPVNFTKSLTADNSLIWRCIEEMDAQTKAIDVLTVNYQLQTIYQVDYSLLLVNYTDGVCSAQHLKYWAFILLEMDIRTKFCQLINNWQTRLLDDPIALSKLNQIKKVMEDPGRDLFKVIEGAVIYLKGIMRHRYSQNLKDFCQDIEHLTLQLNERLSNARKVDYYLRLKDQLSRLEQELGISTKDPQEI